MNPLEYEINTYINTQLLSRKGLSKVVIAEDNQKEQFLNRLFLRKYRKYATTQEVRDFVKSRLDEIIDNKLPMRFVPSFGGYKHWWCPTYPKTDWAEVFNVKFLLEYLAPIYNSYIGNDVCITYESEEVILAELNNIPQSGLDEYTKSFRDLLMIFQQFVGPSPKLSLVLAREQYNEAGFSKEWLLKRITEMMPDYTARFNSYEPEDQKRRIAKVRTNFKIDGVVDYTKATPEEISALYKHSRILNETFLDADFEIRGEAFFDDPSTIPLLFTFGLGPGGEAWPHIGSSSSSMVDFWAGMGIIEKRDNGALVPRIISRSQYELIKDSLVNVPVTSQLTGSNQNYDSIMVYEGTLIF